MPYKNSTKGDFIGIHQKPKTSASYLVILSQFAGLAQPRGNDEGVAGERIRVRLVHTSLFGVGFINVNV